MKKKNVSIPDELTVDLPEMKTTYWYIRAAVTTAGFVVVEAQWMNWKSDVLRLVRGNMYLDQRHAMSDCKKLNNQLSLVLNAINRKLT